MVESSEKVGNVFALCSRGIHVDNNFAPVGWVRFLPQGIDCLMFLTLMIPGFEFSGAGCFKTTPLISTYLFRSIRATPLM